MAIPQPKYPLIVLLTQANEYLATLNVVVGLKLLSSENCIQFISLSDQLLKFVLNRNNPLVELLTQANLLLSVQNEVDKLNELLSENCIQSIKLV